jgi:IclR family transcriptional regulator, KDG regulon repressor
VSAGAANEAIVPRIAGADSGDSVRAVVLALQILEYLAEQPDAVGVTALAQALGTTKSRVHRHLRTLVRQGYIVQAGASEKYRVGVRLATLGQAVSDNFQLANVGRAVIRALREALGHFCVVSQLEGEGMRAVATVSGKSVVEVSVKQGSLLGFHDTAQGKIALAFGDDALRATVLRARLDPKTPETVTRPRALLEQIERIRRQGWATAANEAILGINALAAPIFGPGEEFVGAVAIVDSVQFIKERPSPEQIARVIAAARDISRGLGSQAAQRRATSGGD